MTGQRFLFENPRHQSHQPVEALAHIRPLRAEKGAHNQWRDSAWFILYQANGCAHRPEELADPAGFQCRRQMDHDSIRPFVANRFGNAAAHRQRDKPRIVFVPRRLSLSEPLASLSKTTSARCNGHRRTAPRTDHRPAVIACVRMRAAPAPCPPRDDIVQLVLDEGSNQTEAATDLQRLHSSSFQQQSVALRDHFAGDASDRGNVGLLSCRLLGRHFHVPHRWSC